MKWILALFIPLLRSSRPNRKWTYITIKFFEYTYTTYSDFKKRGDYNWLNGFTK